MKIFLSVGNLISQPATTTMCKYKFIKIIIISHYALFYIYIELVCYFSFSYFSFIHIQPNVIYITYVHMTLSSVTHTQFYCVSQVFVICIDQAVSERINQCNIVGIFIYIILYSQIFLSDFIYNSCMVLRNNIRLRLLALI